MALEQQRLKLSFYDQTGFKGGAKFNYVITANSHEILRFSSFHLGSCVNSEVWFLMNSEV